MSKKLSDLLNLEKAYDEVLYDERHGDDFIPDILNFLNSRKFRNQILQELKRKIDNEEVRTNYLVKMDIPKDSFFIRPGGRPCLEDWILYQALADYIGSKADKKLAPNVYSCRFNPKTGQLFHWLDQWLKFDRAFWDAFEKGFNYVLKTDITAYFANINIERLRNSIIDVLDKSAESDQIVQLLFQSLLRPWADREENKGYGLPQGINASRVLANLLLLHVDASLSRKSRRLRYLRYSDDIRILARGEIDAKVALKTLIGELRHIGLDLNEKKTQILKPPQVEQLRDPRSQDMNTIQTVLNSRNKDLINLAALPLLHDVFERSFDSSNVFGDRHLRFSINCFVRLKEIYKDGDKEIGAIGLRLTEKLKSMPGSANTFSRFFSVFPQDSFKKQLLKFLKSKENIYEWQEMWILDSLLRFQSFTQSELEVFGEIAFDKDRRAPTRSKAILLLGKFGNSHERYELTRKFNEEMDYLVKRAIVVATQELSIAERNDFYSTVKRTDPEQAALIDFVKPLRKPIYFDAYIPAPILPIEEPY